MEIGAGSKDAAARLTGDLIEAVEEIKVKDCARGRVRTKEALGIGKGGVCGAIKATRDSNAKLSSWEEMTSKGVGKDGCVDGGSETAPSSADADRTKFAKVAGRIFAEGDEEE